MYQLGKSVKREFETFLDNFKSIIKKILSFPNLVNEDFRNLYKFPDLLDEIKDDAKNAFIEIDSNLRTEVNNTLKFLQENS